MTDDRLVGVLERIAAALETIAGDQSKNGSVDHADLLREIEADLGPAPFTARGLLRLVEDYPDGSLAAALRRVVNVDDQAAAVALGRLLAVMPGLEPAGDKRGVRLYRLRG